MARTSREVHRNPLNPKALSPQILKRVAEALRKIPMMAVGHGRGSLRVLSVTRLTLAVSPLSRSQNSVLVEGPFW